MTVGRGSILGALPFAAALMLAPLGAAERGETGMAGHDETGAAEYQPIGADAEPLRSAFNAGAGKVRILMLVAPT